MHSLFGSHYAVHVCVSKRVCARTRPFTFPACSYATRCWSGARRGRARPPGEKLDRGRPSLHPAASPTFSSSSTADSSYFSCCIAIWSLSSLLCCCFFSCYSLILVHFITIIVICKLFLLCFCFSSFPYNASFTNTSTSPIPSLYPQSPIPSLYPHFCSLPEVRPFRAHPRARAFCSAPGARPASPSLPQSPILVPVTPYPPPPCPCLQSPSVGPTPPTPQFSFMAPSRLTIPFP